MLSLCLVALSLTLPVDKEFHPSYANKFMGGAPTKVKNCMRLAQLAKEMDAPVTLVLAIASRETGFKSGLVSSAGARGLLGVMPSNMRGRDKSAKLAWERRGIEILKFLLDYKTNLCDALAYYNAGGNGSCNGIGGRYAASVMDRQTKLCLATGLDKDCTSC